MKQLISLVIYMPFIVVNTMAQEDSAKTLSFSAYLELYYSYDFSQPVNHEKPEFLYNHKRHNEVNVNLALVKAAYQSKKTRAHLGLMAGNYAQYNLAAEPEFARFIFEANAGIKLSKNKNVWLDAGILPSHIGFESALGADCHTLTRSMVAENSPYYETGVKLSYQNEKGNFNTAFLILNGWQRIKKPDYIQLPSTGMQVNYQPSEKLTLNYSNFIGTDKPDSLNALRTYHDFYLVYKSGNDIRLVAGLDIGTDKKMNGKYGAWFSPVVIVSIPVTKKLSFAGRAEYFNDKHEIIITTGTPNGFQTWGFSAGTGYSIKKLLWRAEAKLFCSKDKLFSAGSSKTNFSLTTALCIRL